jgi:hypothetical protein
MHSAHIYYEKLHCRAIMDDRAPATAVNNYDLMRGESLNITIAIGARVENCVQSTIRHFTRTQNCVAVNDF